MQYFLMEENTIRNSFGITKYPEEISYSAVLAGELQHLDKQSIEIEVRTSGQGFNTDLSDNLLPLFSDRLKKLLDREGVDNIFYKPVYLVDKAHNCRELFWLAVVAQIDCLNRAESEFDEDEDAPTVFRLAIVPEKVGRYQIFKLKGVADQFLIVTESLKNKLTEEGLKGIRFTNIKDYQGI